MNAAVRQGDGLQPIYRPRVLLVLGLALAAVSASAQSDDARRPFGGPGPLLENTPPRRCPEVDPDDSEACGNGSCVVDFRESASVNERPEILEAFRRAVARENVTVRIGPDVVLDFTDSDQVPLRPARCVTIRSVAGFLSAPGSPGELPVLTEVPDEALAEDPTHGSEGSGSGATGPATIPDPGAAGEAVDPADFPSVEDRLGRYPTSPGPVLRYGGPEADFDFIKIFCNHDDAPRADGVRISGFRLIGPDFDQVRKDRKGIEIFGCRDVEISHMEIAGWNTSGIYIRDDEGEDASMPGGRIHAPEDVRVTYSYFHHNQYPRGFWPWDTHASGYGVVVQDGAWALIRRNVFDWNRHGIAASGAAGGYDAIGNLVLKGGGVHHTGLNLYTHQFDIHADGKGDAGDELLYAGNAFQYTRDPSIKIRGKPRVEAVIRDNSFPPDDWTHPVVKLATEDNVTQGPGNLYDYDSFGKYGVCDFDGDGVDDLFLPTRVSWWYSPKGQFVWTPLNQEGGRLSDLHFAYVDDDRLCDVVAGSEAGDIYLASGGGGQWRFLGNFGVKPSELAFGRFGPIPEGVDPADLSPTTHVFRRASDGQWSIAPLDTLVFEPVEKSAKPMEALHFADFTGDGITDVVAVVDGRWQISESARTQWRLLNASLGPGGFPFVADLDDNGRADLLWLRAKQCFPAPVTLTWHRSKDGTEPWTVYEEYPFVGPGFVGGFREGGAAATLVIDPDRVGHFRSGVTVRSEWNSRFLY